MNSKADGAIESVMNPVDPSWSLLVEQVRNGDPSALEQMYHIFSKGIRFFLCRQLGPQDLDDRVHDVFLIIAQSIQKGDLREPERFMGYVRTIVRRHVAAHIDEVVKARRTQTGLEFGMTLSDHHLNPELSAIEHQNQELALRILHGLPKRDREVLIRFYLEEQPPDRIRREMHLTETQFRLIKSRAKARFGDLGRTRLSRRNSFRF
ncbi:MAG: sigma-70 family RNA polymerase sigma factor [Bryobacteraceae bacterium]|jgi:RNA polymerase sigma factor (sigma-70 family)